MDTTMNDAYTKAPNVSLAKLFGVFLYIGATCVWRIADFCGKSVIRLRHHTSHEKGGAGPACA